MRSSTPWRPPQWIARVGDFLPVLEGGALIVAPEFRSRVKRRKVDERFGITSLLPVARATAEILRYVETERHRQLLLLDGGKVEVCRRRNLSLGHFDHVVDRFHGAGPKGFSWHEFAWLNSCSKVLEHRFPIRAEAKQEIGHEHRHQPRQRLTKVDLHRFDIGIRLPQRIGRFDQSRTEPLVENGNNFLCYRVDDRLLSLRARSGLASTRV